MKHLYPFKIKKVTTGFYEVRFFDTTYNIIKILREWNILIINERKYAGFRKYINKTFRTKHDALEMVKCLYIEECMQLKDLMVNLLDSFEFYKNKEKGENKQ